MNQILRCNWLRERVRWSYLARSGLPALSRKKISPKAIYNKSFIDQACSLKMAWYWPGSFFACLWTETESRSINTQKKNSANIQPSRPHPWSIYRTYYMASSASGQDESNPALWLATRAGKMEPSCPLGTTRLVPQETFPQKPYNKSFIDQACSVKMAWYWPRSFFACLWTETESRSINTQKKNEANIQPSWPRTWSITLTSWTHCFMFETEWGSGTKSKNTKMAAGSLDVLEILDWCGHVYGQQKK